MRVPTRVRWVDFSPDTRQIAIASADGTVGIWEVALHQAAR
jgi:WD40 repeat protein